MSKFFIITLSLLFALSSLAQTTSAPKKRSSIFQFDKDISKIFTKKKKAPKKTKSKKIAQTTPASTPKKEVAVPPKVVIAPLNDNMAVSSMPKFYKKRSQAIFNIGLIYYGDLYTDENFSKVQDLLEKRFELATNGELKLNVIFRAILPFKNQIKDLPDYKFEQIVQKEPVLITEPVTDMDKLQRIWYAENKGMSVVNEVYQEAKTHNLYGKDFSKLDALAVVTGAQFEGLGFASGRVAITENPMEIAYGHKYGRTEIQSDAKVVDELLHELGHSLSLGHATEQCFANGIDYKETQACCALAENKNDVLSYCRQRDMVNENFFYGFEACNMKTIREKIIPAMLKGGEWELKDVAKCE